MYLRGLKDNEDLRLSTSYDLFNGFMSSDYALNFVEIEPERIREQFETCIGFLETMGLMRRFKFGGLVLLKPELLDFYASAIINAAKHSEDGFGTISEWKIWNAEFYIPDTHRLLDKQEESWMLIATVDDLLNHEICFRSDGYLIFPSHFVQEYRDSFELTGNEEIEFTFEGPIANIYAIIIVRLGRSGDFILERITRNKVTYSYNAPNHGRCSLRLEDNGQGVGTLTLYFEETVPQLIRYSFEMFIYRFLKEYSLKGSVQRNRVFTCPECHSRITHDLVKKRLERGFQYIVCPVCNHEISLVEPLALDPAMNEALRTKMKTMGKSADVERKREAAKSMLEGKMATGNLDVMMVYSQRDRTIIDRLAGNLRDRGVYPEASIGEISSQDLLDEMLPKVRSVAIFPGVNGELPTDNIRETVTQCKRAGLSVMIGILPNSNNIPKDLLFIKDTKWVYFFDSVDDELALNELEFGITGRRPE
jgi:hypothetical protein